MTKPSVCILWFPGTNCHHEMARAFEKAGATVTIVLLRELIDGRRKLTDCDILGFPGGFSFGDHFGSGRVAAFDLVRRFGDQLAAARDKRIPMLGVCNGFQILVTAGLLPGDGGIGMPTALLDANHSARFEHWSETKVVLRDPGNCVWTRGLGGREIVMPVAHGEGRLVGPHPERWTVMATYATLEGDASYPASPNGSPIAGICNEEIAGLMPHPERRIDALHGGDGGLAIFKAGVGAVR
ncbi:phosphoribosylformylglycinamidine synthase [Patescibacteria group bacterium]|nr:MAG: phosphoribosylformylglycinamidine synthase [Patescibacteria group bacterium]